MPRAVLSSVIAVLGLVVASPAGAQVVERPLSDAIGPNLTGPYFYWYEPGNPSLAFLDMFGRFAMNAGLALNSSFEGKVTEQALADGTAHVRVQLHARNVLVWVQEGNAVTFGATAGQVSAGATPALGDSLLTYEFINSAPGAPLPNLVFTPVERLLLVTNATGTFTANSDVAAGTKGRLHVTQRGLNGVPGMVDNPGQDNVYPVETVNLTVTGKR